MMYSIAYTKLSFSLCTLKIVYPPLPLNYPPLPLHCPSITLHCPSIAPQLKCLVEYTCVLILLL